MRRYEFDTTIIGGGCIGSSILFEYMQRGFAHVALIDSGRNSESATANSGGMLRVFHESTVHLDLALQSHFHLQRLQNDGVLREKAKDLGHLYFFKEDRHSAYHENLKRMDEAQYPFEVLTRERGLRKFPQFQWKNEELAVYEPRGSQLSPQVFVQDLLSASLQKGAEVLDNFKVIRLSRHRDHYHIFSPDATVVTKNLILAGGAGILPRLPDLGLKLPLEAKRVTTYLAPKIQDDVTLPNFFDRENLDFGGWGDKASVILGSQNSQRVQTPFWSTEFKKRMALDCYAPDRLGFSGQIAGHPQLSLATGWGGTGFKFALEIAHRIADSAALGQHERNTFNAFI